VYVMESREKMSPLNRNGWLKASRRKRKVGTEAYDQIETCLSRCVRPPGFYAD
jgi:hypothetical protein